MNDSETVGMHGGRARREINGFIRRGLSRRSAFLATVATLLLDDSFDPSPIRRPAADVEIMRRAYIEAMLGPPAVLAGVIEMVNGVPERAAAEETDDEKRRN